MFENETPDTNGFEALTASLGFSQASTEATDNSTAETGAAETEENNSEETQQQEASTEQTDATATNTAAANQQEERANHAFAAMRTQLGKFQKPIERAAAAAGMSVEEFLGQLENVAANKQAKDQGVSRDILDRLEKTEATNAAYEFEITKHRTQAALVGLQTTMALTNEDMKAFVKDCIEHNVDLTAPGVDMVTLYKGRNHDKLLEKARNEWVLKDSNAQSRASTPTTAQGRGGAKAVSADSPEALRNLLASMPK